MLVLDLQWLLFALVCAALLAAVVLANSVRRQVREPRGAPAPPLLDRAPLGLLVLDDDSINYANHQARDLLHLGSSVRVAIPSTDWSDLLREDLATARRVRVADPPGEGRFRTVSFPSDLTVRWWVSSHDDYDLVLLWDVTHEERVQRSGRALISDLGHELRTPLATLLTHLEILGLDYAPPSEAPQMTVPQVFARTTLGEGVWKQSLQIAKREAQRMSRLVNDMLELGRLESAETLSRRPLDLAALAEEVVLQTMAPAREYGLKVELVAGSGLPLVLGNGDRLRQALLNLLDNALKYGGRGAAVTVALEREEFGIACAVCDTGPGIAPEHLSRVGQRFYRAASETIEGSGLGLSVVHEVLRLHGSELAITSPVNDGRGTCVRFLLPVVDEEVRP
jgi:two-component system, OmpR family, phosphate regulon sensor histidine kinase PhoR